MLWERKSGRLEGQKKAGVKPRLEGEKACICRKKKGRSTRIYSVNQISGKGKGTTGEFRVGGQKQIAGLVNRTKQGKR